MTQANKRTPRTVASELVTGDEGADAKAVKTVVGRRVRGEKEEFVIDDEASNGRDVDEVQIRCGSCGVDNPESAWDENDDACPECAWKADEANEVGASRERLSEAELLFEMIGGSSDEDEYVIKVDHLPNYFQDGKANTTALKKFCRYLRGNEVTIDFMETVRRSCVCPCLEPGKEGRFLFTASKVNGEDRGFKKRWDDSITKPMPEEKPAAAATPTAAPAPLSQRSGLEELKESMGVIKELYTIMNPRGQVQPNPAPLPPAPPPDPMETVSKTFDLLKSFRAGMDEVAPPVSTGEDSIGVTLIKTGGDLLKSIINSPLAQQVGRAMFLNMQAQQAAANGGNAETRVTAEPPTPHTIPQPALGVGPQPGEGESPGQPTPAPAAAAPVEEPAALGPQEMEALSAVVSAMRDYIADDDNADPEAHEARLEGYVAKAAEALLKLPPSLVKPLTALPNAVLVSALVQINPNWSDVANDGDSLWFIRDLKQLLEKMAEQASNVVDFPSGAEAEEPLTTTETTSETEPANGDEKG